ncbi:HNH endonuclease signature motif containing protein [Flavobacterium gawalongense]|uniref:HNH endonuclease n=1 Tax=Flavobacterium gawalongense TaxID=2594432 RepID=A0A553B9R6_9FLAO|nr:HNH endonuclease signature motif containing protein [Flavobacterium gawalongense]TRW96382.1 HNH endonuclease [Flavobacterium gawalongense]TRX01035.1 HNH endonuclease [Flavobacterium gawalongense]TRX04998.1 HNH endonuclease [Flavobacterium gawalongense]TRX05794.1 HNH endonuclease [Flavobacterium gawalongense]TRX21484.1 HNH endonuclease [Flavobacterium gawalongense]
MAKKTRTPIPQLNKVRAVLQQEINSKCPFCNNEDVAHFDIHHIDKIRNNHKIENLLLVCKICHSKIHNDEISFQEVIDAKFKAKNCNSNIQFISITIDSENCGWEPYENIVNAFKAVNLKSLFPIFNFSLINNSDKPLLLTNIVITNKHLPVGLNGPYTPLPYILRPIITYKIKLPGNNKTINTSLIDEIVIPQGEFFKFQIELYSESMDDFSPLNKYALNLKFGFNNDFYIDIPKILLNSDKDYNKLTYIGIN